MSAIDVPPQPAARAVIVIGYGEFQRIELDPADIGSSLRRHIQCDRLDAVRLTSIVDMWVAGEDAFGSPPNPAAALLAEFHGHTRRDYHGRAALASSNDAGEIDGLTPDQATALARRLRDLKIAEI